MSSRHPSRLALLVLPVVVFAAACSSSVTRSSSDDSTTSTVVSTTLPADDTSTTLAADTSSTVATTAPPTAPPTTKAPAPTGAVISNFSVSAPTASCPSGGTVPEVTITWKVTNADSVFVGIDSPDKYQDVPLVGSLNVPFSCGSSHTYYVVATKNGVQTVKSKTVS